MTFKMRKAILFSLFGVLLAACGAGASGGRKPASEHAAQPVGGVVEPVQYTYRVVNVYPHPTDAYTQGLQFADGLLWEGTGQNGESRITKTDLATGRTTEIARLPKSDFGEGITLLGGRIYQLTWLSNKAYQYDAATGRELDTFRYAGEGWGLTTDGTQLYMSDGTERIRTLDPETFKRQGPGIAVTCRGQAVTLLNELEWIDGRIWANVYTTNLILIIDPATGVTEGIIDLTGLLPAEDRRPGTDVLNGIACDPATGRIFVTGKNWPKLFEIEILRK